MVTMNLRVGTGLTSLQRDRSMPLEDLDPSLEDLSQIDSTCVDYFKRIFEASSINDQIVGLRQIAKDVEVNSERHQIVSIVFIQWYFNCDNQSPIRKALKSCLNSNKNKELEPLLQEQVTEHLKGLCTDSELELSSKVIESLSKCLDNLKCAEAAVIAQGLLIVDYVQKFLLSRIEQICESDIAPVEKAKLIEEASEGVRVLVSVTKRCCHVLSDVQLVDLCSLTGNILAQHDLPLDLRTNCGILVVLATRKANVSQVWETLHRVADKSARENELSRKIEGNWAAVLGFLHGVLSVFTIEEILAEGLEPISSILNCYLNISRTEKEPGLILGHSRGLLNLTSKMLASSMTEFEEFASKLFDYVWLYLEHHIDSVKHNTRNILNNTILLCKKTKPGDALLDGFIKETLALPLHKKSRFVSLSSLIKHDSASRLLERYPDLQSDVLNASKEYALVNNLSDLYENLLNETYDLYQQSEREKWQSQFVQPLLQCFMTCEDPGPQQLASGMIKKALRKDKTAIHFVLKECNYKGKGARATLLALQCLKTSRDMGHKWQFKENEELLLSAAKSGDNDTQMQALKLCVESKSSIEVFESTELQFLLKFVRYNLAIEDPSTRQTFVVVVKKMLKRISESISAARRKVALKKHESETGLLTAAVSSSEMFLKDFFRLMFENLFNGANFARRCTVLELLLYLQEVCGSEHLNLNLMEVRSSDVNSLVSCLSDTYEHNKKLALSLLLWLIPFGEVDEAELVSQLFNKFALCLASYRPTESVTASYLIKVIVNSPMGAWTLADRLSLVQYDPAKTKFYAAVFVRNLLTEQIKVAEESLLEAAGSGPMYGALYAIRSIYEEIEVEEYDEEWATLTSDLLKISSKMWTIVQPVVASSSPEGHCPMDLNKKGNQKLKKGSERFVKAKQNAGKGNRKKSLLYSVIDKVLIRDSFSDEIAEDIVEDILNMSIRQQKDLTPTTNGDIESDAVLKTSEDKLDENCQFEGISVEELEKGRLKDVSSQMLLLCAWRSVKEISLFLGDLCATHSKHATQLISVSQTLEIASFLMNLLSETKHRGAFEQAYVAFTKLCSTLWRAKEAELHCFPAQLLKNLLQTISNDTKAEKKTGVGLCSTRRSAGVPFIVQAVVSTDPDPKSSTFNEAMSTLLALAASRQSSKEARVHSANILRALYRDTRLGDAVSVFVEKGVQVAVEGFKARSWAERNASTLLFSSLMTRIFGINREKESVSSKNCLTGKVFFQRYPELHPFLLKELSENTDDGSNQGVLKLYPSVYPVLLLLARLYPSSEDDQNPLKLSTFLPLVSRCSKSPIYQTRQLAAKAIVPLVGVDRISGYLKDICEVVKSSQEKQNSVHGHLMLIKEFIHRKPECAPYVVDELFSEEDPIHRLLNPNGSYLIASVLVEIATLAAKLSDKNDSGWKDRFAAVLLKSYGLALEQNEANMVVNTWLPLFLKSATEFLCRESLEQISWSRVLSKSVEVQARLSALQYLREVLKNQPDLDVGPILTQLALEETNEGCLEEVFYCCSYLPQVADLAPNMKKLLASLGTTHNDSLKAALLTLTSKVYPSVDDKSVKFEWTKELYGCCQSSEASVVREAAANALVDNVSCLTKFPSKINSEERWCSLMLWSSVFVLLYDDEASVRRNICRLSSVLLGGAELSTRVSVELLLHYMVGSVGRAWPAAALLVVVSHLLRAVYEHQQPELELPDGEADGRAFEKGELNTYQEKVSLAVDLCAELADFVTKLSPGLAKHNFETCMPEQILKSLMPDLPAAVSVFSIKEVFEYLSAQSLEEFDLDDAIVIVKLFDAVKCDFTREVHDTFFEKNKACLEKIRTKDPYLHATLTT